MATTDTATKRQGLRLVLALAAVLVVAAAALSAVLLNRGTGGGDDTDAGADATAVAADDAATASEATPCPPPSGAPAPAASPYDEPPVAELAGAQVVQATVETSCGTVVLELDAAAAPVTVENFVALAEDGYYDGVGFHRVVDGFMVQGGDPTGTGSGCLDESCTSQVPGYTFPDELDLAEQVVEAEGGYPRGTLAMANRGPDTNGSQFFIMQAEQAYPLPPAYAVFGRVVDGMDVVDRIALGPTDGELAVQPVVILGIDISG